MSSIKERFNGLAKSRELWQKRNRYYYDDQKRYFRYLVSKELKVLDIGCGLGDLLAAVEPAQGVGIDISDAMVHLARQRHPEYEFHVMEAEELRLDEQFDIIILSDVIGHLRDIQIVLERIHMHCHVNSRVVITAYNFLWEPLLKLAEKIKLKMPQNTQNWLSIQDIDNLLQISNFEIVKTERRLLIPKKIPLVSQFLNNTLGLIPGFRRLCLSNYIIARPTGLKEKSKHSVSIIIPCRNEKGNIEAAIERMPRFGSAQEIIFVDGHSTDGTVEAIKYIQNKHPDWNIKLFIQDGIGKGDAVRKGFANASNDILIILDADLTVMPEDLIKFYDALESGKGEFVNGCRLIYPMKKEAMRLLNLFGNKFFALVFSWLLNQRIKDVLCGTKVLFRDSYQKIAADRDYFGDFDPFGDFDLLFGASKQNLKIIEMPVRYYERSYGETNIRRFRHGWLLLKMAIFAFFKLKAV